MKNKKLNIIVPCYNEEDALPETAQVLLEILKKLIEKKKISQDSQICFINDGSKDNTQNIISSLCLKSNYFSYISFTRNFGHQAALLAGLLETEADMYVTIDADLQDDPYKIEDMIDLYQKGNDIVYGVRSDRNTDSWLKKNLSISFYKIQKMMGVKAVYNAADFRFLSERAVNVLKNFHEKNLFLRGIVPLLGFQSAEVYYSRHMRNAGKPKYTFFSLFSLALNGIVGFSVTPIRLISVIGLFFILFSFCLLLYLIYSCISDQILQGWTILLTFMALSVGIILFSIGIVGEYVAKIFTEVKNRPNYIIAQKSSLK